MKKTQTNEHSSQQKICSKGPSVMPNTAVTLAEAPVVHLIFH